MNFSFYVNIWFISVAVRCRFAVPVHLRSIPIPATALSCYADATQPIVYPNVLFDAIGDISLSM